MKVHTWLCEAETILELCGVIIFFTFCGHLEKWFMIAFASKRIGIETMKHLDFKSSELEERNHQIPKQWID